MATAVVAPITDIRIMKCKQIPFGKIEIAVYFFEAIYEIGIAVIPHCKIWSGIQVYLACGGLKTPPAFLHVHFSILPNAIVRRQGSAVWVAQEVADIS